jgi:hypothetical protein
MDDLEKKLVVQGDDDAVRLKAFEAWHDHRTKEGRTWRDFVADYESALPKAKADELEKKLDEYVKANAAAAKQDATQKREIARLKAELKAALWVKANWKMVGAGAAALVAAVSGYWAYERYWSRSDAVTAGLHAAVASATWGEGWSEPVALRIGGEPYWLMFRGNIDASNYSNRNGRAVEMRCLHLYAAPAQPDSGQYLKPSPRFLGVVTWPEVGMQCKPSPNQQADNLK